jgi:hypothetical protein
MDEQLQSTVAVMDASHEVQKYDTPNPFVISQKIYDLTNDNNILKEPMDIILEIYPDEVIAIMAELELTGEGSNIYEALRELKLEILDLYDELAETPDEKLGKHPKSWKRILIRLIEKV